MIDSDDSSTDPFAPLQEPRLWRDEVWTARVIRSEDDEGWAVSMTRRGDAEPALVAPWTMGRDKKNPKPLDGNSFITWVKTASEVLRRHEQQLYATLHKRLTLTVGADRLTITLDIVPDEDEPHAWLAAQGQDGAELARVRVAPNFKLSPTSAHAWVEGEFQKPR